MQYPPAVDCLDPEDGCNKLSEMYVAIYQLTWHHTLDDPKSSTHILAWNVCEAQLYKEMLP